ncbi:hypothetical protein D3C87_2166860 [compost metagenome]
MAEIIELATCATEVFGEVFEISGHAYLQRFEVLKFGSEGSRRGRRGTSLPAATR